MEFRKRSSVIAVILIISMVYFAIPSSSSLISQASLNSSSPTSETATPSSEWNTTVDAAVTDETSVKAAIAGEDNQISLRELQLAIKYWKDDEPVPGTNGETLSLREIQQLIRIWSNDGSIKPLFDEETKTEEIVLRLSDLSTGYNYSGEVLQQRSELKGDRLTTFQNKAILKKHSRSFQLTNGNADEQPALIISAVVIYETKGDAKDGLNNIANQLPTRDISISSHQELLTNVSTTVKTFENDRGNKITLVLSRERNLVYYTVTLGNDQYHKQKAKEFLVKMLIDIS